jgi:Pectate lyase superfamily protein
MIASNQRLIGYLRMKPAKRRTLTTLATLATLSGVDLICASDTRAAVGRVINVAENGADLTGTLDSSTAIQRAIDRLTLTGGTLYFPAGTYRVMRTLVWANPTQVRASGIHFVGDGMHSTIIKSMVREGPLLRVRGIPAKEPFSTTFFWGGGIKQLTLDGSEAAKTDHDAIEVMGWWYAELVQLRIVNFSRHGIRAVTDLSLASNPDFSASTLFVRAVWIERCGGWGFKDDGGVQGSPGCNWEHVVFVLCGLGGAYVQSSGHSFSKCSFSAGGWRSEAGPPSTSGFGLMFDGAVTATSRQWVEGCEFDMNLTAHIAMRFCSVSSFANNRFIAHDRFNSGRLFPSAAVVFGYGDARGAVRSVEFRQSFFRLDHPGETAAYHWANTANVRDVSITNSIYSDNTQGKVKFDRYRGLPADRTKFNFQINEPGAG